ncbi:MAG: PhoU domain-containing protein, partial [Fusobacterium sp.]
MRNLEESLKGLNEHYLEMLKNLNRMLDVNIEMVEEGSNISSLYGECLVVEDIINAFEVSLKENSIIAIARFQPAAKNLRELVMLIDGGRLVERMGDILKKNIKILKEINEESPELAKILNSNQLIVEYRFNGGSRPKNIQYQYLTNDQAMDDLHRIR